MNRTSLKRARAVTTWLLAVFVLRSLIPVGFMPMIGADHSLRLALCDGYGPVPSMAMDMSVDSHMDMSHPGGPATRHDHSTCLFGASPALGAPLAATVPAPVQLQSTGSMLLSAQVNFYEAPRRAQSARGPPA